MCRTASRSAPFRRLADRLGRTETDFANRADRPAAIFLSNALPLAESTTVFSRLSVAPSERRTRPRRTSFWIIWLVAGRERPRYDATVEIVRRSKTNSRAASCGVVNL